MCNINGREGENNKKTWILISIPSAINTAVMSKITLVSIISNTWSLAQLLQVNKLTWAQLLPGRWLVQTYRKQQETLALVNRSFGLSACAVSCIWDFKCLCAPLFTYTIVHYTARNIDGTWRRSHQNDCRGSYQSRGPQDATINFIIYAWKNNFR